MIYPQPKPAKTLKQVKAKKDRAEDAQIQRVRAACVERDGDCRLLNKNCGPCGGASEWAHLERKRRAHTRGRPPHDRHTTEDTMMLCTAHHQSYDRREFMVHFRDADIRADGPVSFQFAGGQRYVEDWKR